MTGVMEKQNSYLADFERFEQKLGGAAESRIHRVRKDAIHRFADLGFPTTRLEEWKYTNVAPIAKTPFQLTAVQPNRYAAHYENPFAVLDCSELLFVNGRCTTKLSAPANGQGVRISSLAELLASPGSREHGQIEQHLARYADYSNHAFVALNTAFLGDGAVVVIPDGHVAERPICLLFISTGGDQPVACHPRVLVLAGRDCQASIVEAYLGPDGSAYFTNAVTEIVAGENAVIDHYKLQQEGDRAFHIATIQVHQDRSSNFHSHSISLGGALVRNDINVVLDGDGAECTLDGLYVEAGDQHVDNHTLIDHARPHGSSREVYKGILDGKATGVFNGSVVVRKDAQKTDARQTNKNLLLSESAEINTKPQLEINADDVKCSHGATIGQMDQEAIFYLRSRGIPYEEARNLLIYAFSNEILGRVKDQALRACLEDEVFKSLAVRLQ
jgi:Fe-S cluster assembly protein SufD